MVGRWVGALVGAIVGKQLYSLSGFVTKPSMHSHTYELVVDAEAFGSVAQTVVSRSHWCEPLSHGVSVGMCVGDWVGSTVGATVARHEYGSDGLVM